MNTEEFKVIEDALDVAEKLVERIGVLKSVLTTNREQVDEKSDDYFVGLVNGLSLAYATMSATNPVLIDQRRVGRRPAGEKEERAVTMLYAMLGTCRNQAHAPIHTLSMYADAVKVLSEFVADSGSAVIRGSIQRTREGEGAGDGEDHF